MTNFERRLRSLQDQVLNWMFLWSGTKLFGFVDVYAPDGDDEPVRGVGFAIDEATWEEMRK